MATSDKLASASWDAYTDEMAKLSGMGSLLRAVGQSFLRPIARPAALWGSKATKVLKRAKTKAELPSASILCGRMMGPLI